MTEFALGGLDELFAESAGWTGGELIGFDLETTGTDPFADRIVTAAVVGPGAMRRTWLVNPGVPIPPEASAVHGVTDERARTEGRPAPEVLPEIAGALVAAVESGIPVVVYRAGFDLTMLACELRRHGLPEPDWSAITVLDPYVLDKQADRYRKGKRTLSDVTAHYGVKLEGAHSADADATATVELCREIGRRHAVIGGMAVRKLHDAQADWHAADAAGLERYFRSKGREESVDQRWPLRLDE
ncbi:exonuclease domain-containing protein [Phytomonospora sp. NPDC050363]|uniref:exonuclease domain-containing protein n=1 Tax=Phytomonospora sp. NPDC050363 TaxID=3155642 RepID=UPI0033E39BC2